MSVPDSSSAIIEWTHVIGNDTWTQVNDPCGNLGEWESSHDGASMGARAAWQDFSWGSKDPANPPPGAGSPPWTHFYERTFSGGMSNGYKPALFPWQTSWKNGALATVTRYSIIAHYSASHAGDYIGRLPISWEFQGSTDNDEYDYLTWTTLDTRSNVNWTDHAGVWHAAAQHVAFHFEFANTTPYMWYRIKWNAKYPGQNYMRIVYLQIWEHSVTPPSTGFTLSKTTATVSESGTTDTLTIVLDAQPNNSVTFAIVSSDTSEVTGAPSTLSFTNTDWNTPKTITFTGVNDSIIDGNQTTNVNVGVSAAGAGDAAWLSVPDQTVTVTTTDDDAAGFTINKTTATVNESGTTDTIIVSLNIQPNSNVVLNAVSADTDEVTVSPSALTFTTLNWNTPQTLTLTGVNDDADDGNQTTLVTLSVNDAQSDDNFDSVGDVIITVTTTDYNISNNYNMSTAVVSGGFPHLYRTDVSGAPVDKRAERAVARADVAELLAELTPAVEIEPEHHLVNVAAKRALTATEFKQMFYARGDDHFELANVYECNNVASNILASVWGKRQNKRGLGLGIAWKRTYTVVSNGGGTFPLAGESLLVTDAFGVSIKFEFVGAAAVAGTGIANIINTAYSTPNPPGLNAVVGALITPYSAATGAPAIIRIQSNISVQVAIQNLTTCILWAAAGNAGSPWSMTAVFTGYDLNQCQIEIVATVNSASTNQNTIWVTVPAIIINITRTILGRAAGVYNTSRVINYNRLGGRPDDPSGVDMAYGYATDLQRTFFAQFEVMGNLEKDLCVKRDCWTLCSRINIEDQLYGLAFVAEDCDDVCMKVSCARKWSEVEDALAESCLAENNTIGYGDIVDLYINVRVTNANPKSLDTIIRIRFPVQLTRGPDDLGNWNVVASNAASAVLTTGIPYDSVEGGNMQYANASQTELQPAANNQQQTQLPNSTAPANSNDSTDPHDGVPLS